MKTKMMLVQSLKFMVLTLSLVASLVFCCAAQTADPEPSVTDILSKAEAQRSVYLKEFRNLVSVENKSFAMFDREGHMNKHRDVKSTFIVYELSKDDKVATEFRNVLEVDGKPIDNNEKRAEDFFRKVASSATADAEQSTLHEESLRYDPGIKVSGFTLFQSVELDHQLWPYFNFKVTGHEILDGHDTYVVEFTQTKFCPFVYVNAKKERGKAPLLLAYNIDLKANVDYHEQLSGKLYIDSTTYQVRREQRTMTIKPEGYEAPAVIDENEFDFSDSIFGILTPKKISHTQYAQIPKEHRSIKWGTIVYDYDKFSKPDVTITTSDGKAAADTQNKVKVEEQPAAAPRKSGQ